jgi:peptidyl-prolyl cis-trans isomerase SurA
MKKLLFKIIMVLNLTVFAVGSAWAEQPVNAIAAVVGSSIITQTQLDKAMAMTKKRIKQAKMTMPSQVLLKRQVLEQLINRQVQLNLIKRAHFKLTSTQLKAIVKRVAAQNHLTVAQLYKKAEVTSGLKKSAFRKQLREQALLQMLQQQQVGSRISISKQEVDDFLKIVHNSKDANKQYHLMDFMIALPDEPTTAQVLAVKAKAIQAMKALSAGESVKKLVATQPGLQSTDLGWKKLAELPTPFVGTVEGMKKGQLAGPIQVPNGFHILKLVSVKSAGIHGTLKEQHAQIEKMLFERQYRESLMNWIEHIRSQTYIKIEAAR